MSEWRSFLMRAAVLAGCAAVVWVAGVTAGAQADRLQRQAGAARADVQQSVDLARRLLAARARGGVSVQRMPRSEANSWAYWESVARQSRIPTDSFTIEPSFTEPAQGATGPTLLAITVHLNAVTLRQLVAFLFYMTQERPYVGISSVDAGKGATGAWDATVESFIYFEEPAPGAGAATTPAPV
jgi:hypothetical protein